MSRLNWSRAAASNRWAYADWTPPKPRSQISIASERVAICQADYDKARGALKAVKLKRLLKAKANLLIAYRAKRTIRAWPPASQTD